MIRKMKSRALAGAALSTLAFATSAYAQGDEGLPTIAERTEGMDVIDGLFPLYQNEESGELLMEVTEEQLGDEFIAFTFIENAVIDAGAFRGLYADQRIIRFDRHLGGLELSEVNTAYYFDPENAIARAADANISPAIIGTLELVAETDGDEDGDARYLIAAAPLFKSEMLTQINRPNPFGGPFAYQLGGLNPQMTKYDKVRGYPENVDVRVDYVFSNPAPFNAGSPAVTDARSTTFKVQHSFLAMPDDGYEPRFDDYRVGYFFDEVTDLTSYSATPYRDVINRWRLVKKDPTAELSDPVEPITFWIENTTPVEFRDIVRDAVLAWNESFEQAGFTNAIAVEIQPDDAEWDAGDIRYNVLRWTSSPTPPFGGYGPSFSNPRTGEILAADIMLELVFLQNRVLASETFDIASSGNILFAEDQFDEEGRIIEPETDAHSYEHGQCLESRNLRQKIQFGLSALEAQGAPAEERDEFVRQSLSNLVLHEVGHTIGLQHNMKATSVYSPEELQDASITQGAPSGSVMDYHAANFAPLGGTQGDYEHTRPGFYDHWAIEFGYKPEASDPEVRAEILSRSDDPRLAFGNDADDMRSPWRGIDPRVMVSDHSSDTITYSSQRIELVRSLMKTALERYEEGEQDSYQMLFRNYLVLTSRQATMGVVMAKQIGGVHVERVDPEQESDLAPYTPVAASEQKRAMEALAEHIFAADAFDVPEDLAQHLQQQRRGYDFRDNTEDPKLHQRVLGMQFAAISHITNPRVMSRITDSGAYGNTYSAAEVIQDLNDAIFGNDLMGVTNTYRRNLQIAYAQRLVRMAYGFGWDPVAQGAALAGIEDIRSRFGLMPEFLLPLETRAHRAALRLELGWVD